MNISEDLVEAFAEHTLNGKPVIVTVPDADFSLGSESMIAEDAEITFVTRQLSLKSDDRVTVIETETRISTTYKVRHVRAFDDGKASKAGLLKVIA